MGWLQSNPLEWESGKEMFFSRSFFLLRVKRIVFVLLGLAESPLASHQLEVTFSASRIRSDMVDRTLPLTINTRSSAIPTPSSCTILTVYHYYHCALVILGNTGLILNYYLTLHSLAT